MRYENIELLKHILCKVRSHHSRLVLSTGLHFSFRDSFESLTLAEEGEHPERNELFVERREQERA